MNSIDMKIIYLLFGPSSSGKSSFINTFVSKNVVSVGDGSGVTRTESLELYEDEASQTTFLDIPGYNSLHFSRKMINDQVHELMTKLRIGSFNAVFLFESLQNSSIALKITLNAF